MDTCYGGKVCVFRYDDITRFQLLANHSSSGPLTTWITMFYHVAPTTLIARYVGLQLVVCGREEPNKEIRHCREQANKEIGSSKEQPNMVVAFNFLLRYKTHWFFLWIVSKSVAKLDVLFRISHLLNLLIIQARVYSSGAIYTQHIYGAPAIKSGRVIAWMVIKTVEAAGLRGIGRWCEKIHLVCVAKWGETSMCVQWEAVRNVEKLNTTEVHTRLWKGTANEGGGYGV